MQCNESRWPAASSVEDSSHRFLFLRLLLGLMLGLCINFSSQVEMNPFESFDEWKPELVNAGRAVRMERLTIEEDIVEQYAATDRKAVLKRRRSASRVQFWIAIWKKKYWKIYRVVLDSEQNWETVLNEWRLSRCYLKYQHAKFVPFNGRWRTLYQTIAHTAQRLSVGMGFSLKFL